MGPTFRNGIGLALLCLAAIAVIGTRSTAAATSPAAGTVTCNAGGPYIAECNDQVAVAQLDGTGSSGPAGVALSYRWRVECGTAFLDDPFSPTPKLTLDMAGGCGGNCGRVDLLVRAGEQFSICSAKVTFQDSIAPVITCPLDTTVAPGESTHPDDTGYATATDACNTTPAVTWSDDTSTPDVIVRTWSADDNCNTSSCVQTITIGTEGPHFDIKPGSCPNPFNINGLMEGGSVMPAALLGNDFDVTQVDLDTIEFSLSGSLDGGIVLPVNKSFGDPGTPFLGELCGCHAEGGDGVLDLELKFDKEEMLNVFGLASYPTGTDVILEVSGLLLDGTPFSAQDCIQIINN